MDGRWKDGQMDGRTDDIWVDDRQISVCMDIWLYLCDTILASNLINQ